MKLSLLSLLIVNANASSVGCRMLLTVTPPMVTSLRLTISRLPAA